MTKNCYVIKETSVSLEPQTYTDQQSGMLTIILNEQAVNERHRKTFTIIRSWLTDFS